MMLSSSGVSAACASRNLKTIPVHRHTVTSTTRQYVNTDCNVVCKAAAPVTSASAPTGSSSWATQEARKVAFGTAQEQIEPAECTVQGSIPSWINGDLVTNGGGYYEGMVHMFDGLALVNKIAIRNGKVTETQRFAQCEQWKHIQQEKKMKWREFGTPLPADNVFEKARQITETMLALATNGPGTTDNPSVNIIPLPDGNLLAMSEPPNALYRLDRNLNTLGKVEQPKDGVAGQLQTAHPKPTKDGKSMINFSRTLPAGGIHLYTQDLATFRRKQIAFIRDTLPFAPSWIHDFAVSDNYAIIVEPPLYFNMPNLLSGGITDYLFMDWLPENRTKVHVIKLDGSQVVTHTAPPFFVFHFANAYEEDGTIHVDFGGYKDAKIVPDLCLSPLKTFPGTNVSEGYLWRLSIPAAATQPQELGMPKELMPQPATYGAFCEFPAVAESVRCKKHRYVYSLSAVRPTTMGNALAKHDVETGKSLVWHEPGSAPGEPVFVASPNATSEDDGVVLTTVFGREGYSYLLVLDAKTWTELGRAIMPKAIPYRFHGAFLKA